MSDYAQICQDERRRRQVRKSGLNGLDYVEVSDDQLRLNLYFIHDAPRDLVAGNFRITGGERITGIRVRNVEIGCDDEQDPEADVCVQLTVDKPGDFSTYRLCWVEADERGYPTNRRPQNVDPRYACLDFSFKANCPTDLDCADDAPCPEPAYPQPDINYLAKDYGSLRQLILDRLAVTMPEWKEQHAADIGVMLVDLLAYVGDYLSYYQDAVATEAYLETARQRISVRRHARLVDYQMHEGCNARAWVCVETEQDISLIPDDIFFITGYNDQLDIRSAALSLTRLAEVPRQRYEVFRPYVTTPKLNFYQSHNEIRFYTWGNQQCCLPQGARAATIRGFLVGDAVAQQAVSQPTDENPVLYLQPGDVLIIEEVIGPETGLTADANPAHRQAVRLTAVRQDFDPAYQIPVVEIEWAEADALTFSLCLSALGPPECTLIENISVARGNVVLVDHGQWVSTPEHLGKVPVVRQKAPCEGEGNPADTVLSIGSLTPPPLTLSPVTQRAPLPPADTPAAHMLRQDARAALPQIALVTLRRLSPGFWEIEPTGWTAQADLLASGPLDEHFVAEVDNDGRARIRFGDGVQGRKPQPMPLLSAYYRVGSGTQGNVGAETISHIVTGQFGHDISRVRNPLPAQGGINPETVESVRLLAPGQFLSEPLRAVTPDDYAGLTQNYTGLAHARFVQRAAGQARWTGSWYEMLVAVDPLGRLDDETVNELVSGIERYLADYRRIGHDVAVRRAKAVPLDIELCVNVLPTYFRGHVRAALLDAFSNRPLLNGRLGFFHPDNLTFGDGIYISKLIAVAQAVEGVESVRVTRLQRMFEPPVPADVEAPALTSGVLPLGPLEIARVDNDSNFVENGRIAFDMRGGR